MNTDTLISNAASKLNQGRTDEAENDLKKAVKKQPENADINHLLGLIAAQRRQFSRAIILINKAINLDSHRAVFYNNLALALLNDKQPEKALAAFKQVIALEPSHIGAHYNCSSINQSLGNLESALTSWKKVIQLKPDLAEAYNSCAVIHAQLNNMEQALTFCEQAIKINPHYAGAHYNRGNALKTLDQLEEALKAYDLAIKCKPDYAEAHSNRGNVLFALDMSERAIDSFNMAIQLRPNLIEVHNNLGNVLLKLKRTDEAIAALEKELQLNPNSTSARYLLATLGKSEAPQQSPVEYVSRLFNDCADQFDYRLVDKLGYDAPQQMYDAVIKFIGKPSQNLDILDLGCGTGLCGVTFATFANKLVGIDIAQKMIEKSRERGIYTKLIQGDISSTIAQDTQQYDLILSGDVFIYIGKLDEVFKYAKQRLKKGGMFVFSIEVDEKINEYKLRETGRYAQSSKYIQKLAEINNLEQIDYQPGILRYEHQKPISGSVIVLRLN